jgi:SAM-dependent methyltransferase
MSSRWRRPSRRTCVRSDKVRSIGFDLASAGELQFCRSVLHAYAASRPDDQLYVFHHRDTHSFVDSRCPDLRGRLNHVPHRDITQRRFRDLDLYITTEQFQPGPPTVYTVTLFHGQPSKGVTFRLPGAPDPLACNDALFMYGPLQRQALSEHLAIHCAALPARLSLLDVGYTKSDDLLNGVLSREEVLRDLGLDPAKPTILYAPAYNAGASLREQGEAILESLCGMPDYNVIAKLPIECFDPTTSVVITGGIDWVAVIGRLEQAYDNFRLDARFEADPAMAAADVLVTCVSSVAFEFLALGRPVVYIDTPKFYRDTLAQWFPGRDVSAWEDRTTVNAGREFGALVSSVADLPCAIETALADREVTQPKRTDLRDYLLYNPGKATGAAVDQIERLLRDRVRSVRPVSESLEMLRVISGEVTLGHRLRHAVRQTLTSKPLQLAQRYLNANGLKVVRLGGDYVEAGATIAAARGRGLSICDYRESLEADPRKRGRRDRIIARMREAGTLADAAIVCEIGAGTGQYVEKVIAISAPSRYEIYETDRGWVEFLQSEYASRLTGDLVCWPADGTTLRDTPDGSCGLVHAHAVFVYLPLLQSVAYLKECVRVCRPGGHIVFDCFLDRSFGLADAETWLRGPHRFPMVFPERLLSDFVTRHGLRQITTFPEVYGDGTVDYFVWRKGPGKSP